MTAKVQDSDRERDWARAAALCEESTITPGMLVKEFAEVREAAYAAGVAAEREACIADCHAPDEEPEQYEGDNHGDSFSSGWEYAAWSIAAAIRSRAAQTGGSDD